MCVVNVRLGIEAIISKAKAKAKDLTFRAKAKDLASKAKAKDLAFKAKAKDLTSKAKAKDLNVRHVGYLTLCKYGKNTGF